MWLPIGYNCTCQSGAMNRRTALLGVLITLVVGAACACTCTPIVYAAQANLTQPHQCCEQMPSCGPEHCQLVGTQQLLSSLSPRMTLANSISTVSSHLLQQDVEMQEIQGRVVRSISSSKPDSPMGASPDLFIKHASLRI